MTGEIAAAGDAVMGTLAARAVEPRAGEAARGGEHGLCLNCGTALIGEHCYRCGQSGHVHRTVGAVGHELAHGVLHFEGKIWRTLPMLAFRPGELTRRYVAGERARFLSPLALFLFSVFLMFAVVASLPGAGFGDIDKAFYGADFEKTRAEVADQRLKTRSDIARRQMALVEARSEQPPEPDVIAGLERDIAKLREDDVKLAQAQRFLPPPDGNSGLQFSTTSTWLDAKFRYAKQNPKLLMYKIKTSAYKYSWALIPISLPFIWLLFPFRRGVGMYDHAIFATYSLSFMSLLVVALSMLAAAGVADDVIALAAVFIPPVHIYEQLKGAYSLKRFGALARTAMLLFFTLITSIIFILLLMFVGTLD